MDSAGNIRQVSLPLFPRWRASFVVAEMLRSSLHRSKQARAYVICQSYFTRPCLPAGRAASFVQTTFVLLSTLNPERRAGCKIRFRHSDRNYRAWTCGDCPSGRFAFADALRPRSEFLGIPGQNAREVSRRMRNRESKRVDAWTMRYNRGLSLICGLSGKKYYEASCSRDLERALRRTFGHRRCTWFLSQRRSWGLSESTFLTRTRQTRETGSSEIRRTWKSELSRASRFPTISRNQATS